MFKYAHVGRDPRLGIWKTYPRDKIEKRIKIKCPEEQGRPIDYRKDFHHFESGIRKQMKWHGCEDMLDSDQHLRLRVPQQAWKDKVYSINTPAKVAGFRGSTLSPSDVSTFAFATWNFMIWFYYDVPAGFHPNSLEVQILFFPPFSKIRDVLLQEQRV
jgi:hypothetical protein